MRNCNAPADARNPDLAESENSAHGTVHTGAFNHRIGREQGHSVHVANAASQFHTYTLRWERGCLECKPGRSPQSKRIALEYRGRAACEVLAAKPTRSPLGLPTPNSSPSGSVTHQNSSAQL